MQPSSTASLAGHEKKLEHLLGTLMYSRDAGISPTIQCKPQSRGVLDRLPQLSWTCTQQLDTLNCAVSKEIGSIVLFGNSEHAWLLATQAGIASFPLGRLNKKRLYLIY